MNSTNNKGQSDIIPESVISIPSQQLEMKDYNKYDHTHCFNQYDRPIDKMLEEAREEGRKEEFNKICNSEKRFVESVITQYKEELLDKISKLKISNCYNDSTIFNHKDYVCLSEVKKLL